MAKHHVVIYPMFKYLTRFLLRRYFSSVTIKGDFEDNGSPVLVISNHISWWDGFWMLFLNIKVINRKFHFMMLEEQLRKHWYFRYTGGYSVKRGSRSILETINYTSRILEKRANMVLMFPQGQINSIYNSEIKFEQGIGRITKNSLPDMQILFVVNMIDYFSDFKPNLIIYIKTISCNGMDHESVETQYNRFYAEVLGKQKIKVS